MARDRRLAHLPGGSAPPRRGGLRCLVRDPTATPSPPGHLIPPPSNINATPPAPPGGGSYDSQGSWSPALSPAPACGSPPGRGPADTPQPTRRRAPGLSARLLEGLRCEVRGGRADGVSGRVPAVASGPARESDGAPRDTWRQVRGSEDMAELRWPPKVGASLRGGGIRTWTEQGDTLSDPGLCPSRTGCFTYRASTRCIWGFLLKND